MTIARALYLQIMRRIARWVWQHPLWTLVLVTLSALVTINGAVRVLGGGAPSLLSPRFIANKVEALSRYASHVPRHLFASCSEDRDAQLVASAKRHGVPVSLVRAVAAAESGGGAHRISHAGAMGVMQLMAPTADELGVSDTFDAEENIDGGVRYLAWLWRRYDGEVDRVVAAYNAGPGVVARTGTMRLPAETRHYLARVLTARVRRDLQSVR